MKPAAALRLGTLLLAAAGFSGCALLPGRDGVGAAAPAAAAPPIEVTIDAPGDLKALLERHLDLVRLQRLAQGETVGDTELDRLIDAAPAQAAELLQTEGYFEPQIEVGRSPGAPQRVRLSVRPGARARVTRVDIHFAGDIARPAPDAPAAAAAQAATERVRKEFGLAQGSAFRNPAWADAKIAVIAQLRAAGYAAASLAGSAAQVDATVSPPTVRLYIAADSGPLFRTGPIAVEGLVAHDRSTVIDLAGFGPGKVASEALLLDYQDRLAKAGLFERVSVSMEPDPDQAAAAPITVRLTEQKLHTLTLGVGVSAQSGPRATAEHGWRRVFGWPVTARNKLEWGQARQAWDGDLSTHPAADFYRWVAGGTIERLETDFDTVLSQRLRAGRAQDGQRIERLYFAQFDRSSRRAGGQRDDAYAWSGHYHWTRREIDNPLLPTEGLVLALQGGAGHAVETGSSGESSGPFGRLYARVTGYARFGDRWHGQGRVEIGQINARSGLSIPDALRFRAGGDESVRGYAYRSLGPVVAGKVGSGNLLFTASAELARPLSERLPQFWGAVFVDAGQAADRWSGLKPVFGYGAGLRWRSPVGPLKLDLAYGHAERRFRLHFSVGIVF